ncbi:pentapeptide repeat-containing protein [Inconstantimicrobium porci]|uniref:pentapeptide repeat-containing protein n=1 Tax=Inconstantimicrobium porci TaxID=2652291 RepID=UPI002409E8BD|nr:pentapeptide repeat-containing protein [Inconstantimicrobium porci]MDD6770138.1 pentapeptide repeat-containing protein [Inconstantimicrobium porci]
MKDKLKSDCSKCFGLCCVALYCFKSDGFPRDKKDGEPCINLNNDFTCKVHECLKEKGFKGCLSYDCLGAGQRVCQDTFKGVNWRSDKQNAPKMFSAFLKMRELYEMMWYLYEASTLQQDDKKKEIIKKELEDLDALASSEYEELMRINLDEKKRDVNKLLHETSLEARRRYKKSAPSLKHKKKLYGRPDYSKADLRKLDIKGEDLSGAFLIVANMKNMDLSGVDFLGADMRDADICNADLRNSIYITQAQINCAKGNDNTKLPEHINRPGHWR